MVTSIFAAGLKLGEKQDLTFRECVKFAEALECEFDIMVRVGGMTYEDGEAFIESMWDNKVQPEKFKYERTDGIYALGPFTSKTIFTNGDVQSAIEKCVGKKVKITIEEVE
jgi:hypothetical protein